MFERARQAVREDRRLDDKEESQPVSRILYPVDPGRWSSIWDRRYRRPLAAYPSLERCGPQHRLLFGLAPGGVFQAGLSPVPLVGSYPTFSPLPAGTACAMRRRAVSLSVALSVGSPRLGVTQLPALWSPDFPRAQLPPHPRPPG